MVYVYQIKLNRKDCSSITIVYASNQGTLFLMAAPLESRGESGSLCACVARQHVSTWEQLAVVTTGSAPANRGFALRKSSN